MPINNVQIKIFFILLTSLSLLLALLLLWVGVSLPVAHPHYTLHIIVTGCWWLLITGTLLKLYENFKKVL